MDGIHRFRAPARTDRRPAFLLVMLLAGCAGTAPSTGPAHTTDAGSPIAAASTVPTPVTDSSPSGSTPNAGPLDWIFAPKSDPIDVTVTLDPTGRSEALVPMSGGTVTATGADGTTYSLVIPRDSLPADTTIALTPASIADMPFGHEPPLTVQLSPDGLVLDRTAILTITPARPIPRSEQIAFGYQAVGHDLILASPVVGSDDIQIRVDHFSGNGVTRGLLADLGPVRQRLGGDAERRLSSELSAELVRLRQEDSETQGAEAAAAIRAAAERFVTEVIKPRVAAAASSCAAARVAIETVRGIERQLQILGADVPGTQLADYPGLVENGARICVLEEFELCVDDHVIHRMARIYSSLRHQFAVLGIDEDELPASVLREAKDLAAKCLTFTLKFESTGSATVPTGSYESTVTSEVTLRFDPDALKLSGDATLVNEAFDFEAPCGATSKTGGGEFEVASLSILTEGSEALDQPVNFKMNYLPGGTSESAVINICGSTRKLSIPPFPAWTGTFLAGHQAELDANSDFGGGYIAIDWEVFGGEYYAKKEWIKEVAASGGKVIEAGTFKLYHTPGG